jgi:NAD(P)-dependent dehydrogenase (short-subunit alcohol dehydrogenase family)
MRNILRGRISVITGGGRGIGGAIALKYAEEGAVLFLAARTKAELDRVAAQCTELGAQCRVKVADVSSYDDVRALFDAVGAEFGRVDVVVNAAGMYGPIGLLVDADLAGWEQALRTNVLGTMYACHEAIPQMIKQRSGSIINFSGGGATSPLPRFSAYGASKAAVVRLTETLAQEVSEYGIRVNAIAPGAVDTRLQDQVLMAGDDAGELYLRIRKLRESGEGGTPVSLPAELALFLASDASEGLTGRLISAPHDPWRSWDRQRIAALAGKPWYTLRRIDPMTIEPIKNTVP